MLTRFRWNTLNCYERPGTNEQIPVGKSGEQAIFLRDIAEWKQGTSVGEYDRINQQRFITVTANLVQERPGKSVADINKSIAGLGTLPPGVKVYCGANPKILRTRPSSCP